MVFDKLCSCFSSKKESKKIQNLMENQFLYDEVKKYMPSDLIKYEKEADFKGCPHELSVNQVHLMPLCRNAFYVKEEVIEEEIVLSSRESTKEIKNKKMLECSKEVSAE